MTVPYAFGSATSAIPLSQLDSNFNTPITLGNTAIQLGNTVTTLNNMTLANVTISSVATAITAAQGGTGLTASGANGNVLTSNGTTWVSQAASSGTNITNGTSNVTIASANGSITAATAGNTALTIDTSQNMGLGVTPSAFGILGPVYQVGTASFIGYNNQAVIASNYSYNVTEKYISNGYATYYAQSSGQHKWYNAPSGTAGNAITFTQAMTLDSSGNLLVGYTGIPDSTHAGTAIGANPASQSNVVATTATTTVRLWKFINGNGQVGAVATNGSATAYETSSDYRLKEDIAPMTGALAKISQLKPVTYKWKVDGSAGEGFIAHELQEIVPQCVSGTKDAVDENGNPEYQGIDTSFLVATLTAAIQEQQLLIQQLQADVAALKGVQA